jgi:DNA polymerase-3 subunit alpha
MLDGASRLDDMVQICVADGQPGLGITDHGNMHGAVEFYTACRNAGINPIIGTEAYMARQSRLIRPLRTRSGRDPDEDGGEKLYHHITLLAVSTEGYRNLMRLSSESYLSGFAYKPRVDWELLERFRGGVVATSGCLGGLVAQALVHGDAAEALVVAGRLQDIFGTENFYIELQDHGLTEQRLIMNGLYRVAESLGAPLLATNDSHYSRRSDAVAHDALLCVQTNARISDVNRFSFDSQEYYIKSAREMRSLFSEVPQACDSTLEICERADIDIEFGKSRLPEFDIPATFVGATYQERAVRYLQHLTYEGARRRWGPTLESHVTERLDHELAVISEMGFAVYFLIVWDLIAYAHTQRIRVGPGRGSVGGSAVAYCLGIVEIDPLRYNLLFERFLNSGRAQMPDIDMDFDDRYRGEMIAYAARRYGEDHVAQIITFSTIGARAGVRDAARVLGVGYAVGERISKAIGSPGGGRGISLADTMKRSSGAEESWRLGRAVRELYRDDIDCRAVIDVALGLEGLIRQDGIHAAGVVLSDAPLSEYLPVQRKPESGGGLGPVVTQYDMRTIERLGLLKMDFLGLRNLSVISRALELILGSTGEVCDIDHVDLSDQATFELLRSGETIGVFQLEGKAMRSLLRELVPECFDDVAALIALYRPGPMAADMHHEYAARKNGHGSRPVNDELGELLADTHGLMIYQESIMVVAVKFAGYTLAQADNLRRATGKKDRVALASERAQFIDGCVVNGYDREFGKLLFDIIEPFADYAFNKSHSYGYGMIAYQTAWLKANHPVEYLCALLSSVRGERGRSALYLGECARMGIALMVPDVNRSEVEFAPAGGDGEPGILFGLSAVKGVGEEVAKSLITERALRGKFTSFYDFARRVDANVVHKRPIESLIKAGAFDGLGYSRQGLLAGCQRIIKAAQRTGGLESMGVISLLGPQSDAAMFDERIFDLEFPKGTLLAYEKELCGAYLSGHPLERFAVQLRHRVSHELADVISDDVGDHEDEWVSVGGVVSELSVRTTKRGEKMATFMLEDRSGAIEVTVFPKTYQRVAAIISVDAVVVVKGRIERDEDGVGVIAVEIDPVGQVTV